MWQTGGRCETSLTAEDKAALTKRRDARPTEGVERTMGAALASRNRIVLEIAYDGPASSSRSVDVDANDPRIAELLDSLLADPNTGKVVSLEEVSPVI